jgi:DNA polymerase I-like protein with 3'-5' exonuclease and polymerase domains
MTTFHLTTFHFDRNFPPVISHDIKDGNRRLLVCYDLNNCLASLEPGIDEYEETLDIYLLESILFLGKYHQRYFKGEEEVPSYGLRKHLSEFLATHRAEEVRCGADIPKEFWLRLLAYARELKKHVTAARAWDHYEEVEVPFLRALHALTLNGVTIDGAAIKGIREKADRAHQRILYALDVNNVSGPELKDLNDWARGYGFDEFFPAGRDEITIKDLRLLEDQHQVFKIFSRLDKLKRINSFVTSVENIRNIRPTYKTIRAVTGRCTSTHPNIMGIPKIFRPIVIPSSPDFGIVECDYSQMEVGVAAALSRDQNLIDDFNSTDVYEKAGSLLFGGSGGSRSKAKIIFLGIQYGLSRRTIARLLELSDEEVSSILNRLYGRYSALSAYLASLEKSGAENGFVESVSGLKRYRRDPDKAPNYWEKNWFKNFPIQSSAASIFKKAIIGMHEALGQEPFHLLVPLYDSVVFECPLDRLEWFTGIVVDCMIRGMQAYFPVLQPKVSVNDSDPSCWNSEGKRSSIEEFLGDPLVDIDIRKRPSSNVDWSAYL